MSDIFCVGLEIGDRDEIGVGIWYWDDMLNVNYFLFNQWLVVGFECENER